MNTDDRLSGTLQENILALLCFDQKHALLVRSALTVRHFESHVFREIAGVAMDFLDRYKEPVADHLPDHFEGILKGDDARKAKSYTQVITSLFSMRDAIKGEYVVQQLHKFVRQQTIKSTVRTIVECMEDDRIDEAEEAMQKGLNAGLVSFEAGVDIANPKQALRFLDRIEKPMRWGVDALERFDVGPAPKTLFLLMGATNKGKSWGLINIGKHALLQRKSVLHLTLEMSEDKVAARYMQALFSISASEGHIRVPRFGQAQTMTIEWDEMDRPTFRDPDIEHTLETMIKRRLVRRAPLRVKGFPSGSLTMPMLRAWLDSIERFEGWSPEVIIVDTAELMALNPNDIRGSTGRLFVDLRGLGDERDAAMVTGSQVNRGGMGKQTADETDLAEDISKAFTADTIVTYNQTELEQKMGLARLYVAKNRDGEAKMTALITQSYPMGQFCLDSRLMSDNYLQTLRPRRDRDEEDEPPRRQRA